MVSTEVDELDKEVLVRLLYWIDFSVYAQAKITNHVYVRRQPLTLISRRMSEMASENRRDWLPASRAHATCVNKESSRSTLN